MKTSERFFFCYSKHLHRYLHNKMKFTYVCGAIHEASSKKFWLYELTPGVKKALEEYKEFMGDE